MKYAKLKKMNIYLEFNFFSDDYYWKKIVSRPCMLQTTFNDYKVNISKNMIKNFFIFIIIIILIRKLFIAGPKKRRNVPGLLYIHHRINVISPEFEYLNVINVINLTINYQLVY